MVLDVINFDIANLDAVRLDMVSFAIGAVIVAVMSAFWVIRGMKTGALERALAEAHTSLAVLEAEKANILQAREELSNQFKALSQDALNQSSEQFLKLAQERLKAQQGEASHDLEKRQTAINEMVKPVKEILDKLSAGVSEMKGTDQSLIEQIKTLQRTTSRIDGALRNPRHQGVWGEKVLEGLLEHSGLIKGVHFDAQKGISIDNTILKPDFIISLGDGLKIIVDAKAPIHDFTDHIDAADTEEAYKSLTQNLARQIRSHVQALSRKSYWEGVENVDFTVMFLPSEHIFSAAIQSDPDLIDYAAGLKIIIVSPTLMLSLLKVVSFSWRQVELAENAQKISAAGADLHKRLITYTEHMAKLGRGINQAVNGYNDAVGSMERSVLPQARKFEELHATSSAKTLQEPQMVEQTLKTITT